MQGRICVMTVFAVAVIRRRRDHIASAAFSALFGVGIAGIRMHYESLYNRIEFYLASAVEKSIFTYFS
jgi:hypothetical protein